MGAEAVNASLSTARAKPSPMGRGWPRSGRVRGYDAGILSPRGYPSPPSFGATLTPLLRSDLRPQGEGCARPALFDSRKGRPRRSSARDIRSAPNLLNHPIETLFHLVVGESQFQIAMRLDSPRSHGVCKRLLGVMLAVEFDRQAEAVATEIDDIAGDGRLPSEFQSVEPRAAQLAPEDLLWARAVAAQSARDEDVLASPSRRKAQNRLTGNPSPRRFAPTLSRRERVSGRPSGGI